MASVAVFDVVLAGGLAGYGFYADKRGPIISGIGWAVANIPRHCRRHPGRRMPPWVLASGVLGALAILVGLALHVSSRA
ncbi:MAG TPA: hypothetical protein DDZ67_12745 [Xanthomonadaceae bacterium]|nr:hypothetical protein [Xanthomonadaceae bacterium]